MASTATKMALTARSRRATAPRLGAVVHPYPPHQLAPARMGATPPGCVGASKPAAPPQDPGASGTAKQLWADRTPPGSPSLADHMRQRLPPGDTMRISITSSKSAERRANSSSTSNCRSATGCWMRWPHCAPKSRPGLRHGTITQCATQHNRQIATQHHHGQHHQHHHHPNELVMQGRVRRRSLKRCSLSVAHSHSDPT